MELWVRTADRRNLVKPTNICLGYNCSMCGVYDGNQVLGEYKTEERCLEIIDEIQSLLVNNGMSSDTISALLSGIRNEFIVYKMPKE